MWKNILDVKEV